MLPHMMLGLLMLSSVLLVSASAQCPLTLDPPVLVQQLGESSNVNCSSIDENHDGIYWIYSNTNKVEEVDVFIILSIPHINWDTQARCEIKLNEIYNCSKDLQITVYKSPTDIVVLSNGAVIEGSELELQCDIRDVAPIQNLTVTWYMNNETIKTEKFDVTASTPGNVSSTLSRNLSREDDGSRFTCEALLDLGPHGPQTPVVSNGTWEASVHYAPEFQHKDDQSIYLNSSSDVSLDCEAVGYPSPLYNWTKDGETLAENTAYLNTNQVNVNSTYNCIASNYLGNISKKFNVIVMESATTSAPENTTTPEATRYDGCPLKLTPDKIEIQYGGSASANCSTLVTDADGIGWEASTGGTGLRQVSELMWTVEKLNEWTITAECFITRKDGSQCEKALNITVYKVPDDVLVSPVGNGTMVEGRQHQLKCDISNVAPIGKLQVKWYRDNLLIETEKFSGNDGTPEPANSTLTVTPESVHNGAHFACEAELLLEQNPVPSKMSAPYTAVVHYKPRIQDCAGPYSGKEDEFRLSTVTCKADGNPKPVINWYHQDKPINSSKPLTRNDSGQYTAKVENDLGYDTIAVDIIIEYGPLFSCEDDYDFKEKSHFVSVCEPKGIPKPNSVWFKDGIHMTFPQLWKRHDSGKYLVIATNKHGTANHTLNIHVLYAPEFKAGNSTKEFTQGENVTLDCSAEGRPFPELQWNYPSAANVKNNTRGRQLFVNITGATSTNAGVYRCGATNKIGSVTRTVTLIMKGQTIINNKNIWWFIVFVVVVLLIVAVVIYYRNRRKKHGHYDIVSGIIPLSTPRSSVV